jgi:hypothetical protein
VVPGGIAAPLFTGLGTWFQISCLGGLARAGHTRALPKRAWQIIILVPTFGGVLDLHFGRADGSGELNGRRGAEQGPSGSCISAPPERRTRVTSATV